MARHVALARLADRLAGLGRSRREHVIHRLHIPHDVLREVRRYTPSNSFGSLDGDDDDFGSAGVAVDSERESSEGVRRRPEDDAADGTEGEERNGKRRRARRKFVSFAKYAEMRLFRE